MKVFGIKKNKALQFFQFDFKGTDFLTKIGLKDEIIKLIWPLTICYEHTVYTIHIHVYISPL